MVSKNVVIHPGNEELLRFLQLSVLAAKWGLPLHLHVEGPRGTGKTTLIRAFRSDLPLISRIQDCLYNCDPHAPHCPQHAGQAGFATELIAMPFAEISHSARIATITGSIDLTKLTARKNPEAALLAGTLPRSHRGIVFIDEINRLADTSPAVVDILLDVMGTKPGRLQIEEAGLPTVELATSTAVWAASNPDEDPGPLPEIRRQLADRFDFTVRTGTPQDREVVKAILRQHKREEGSICLRNCPNPAHVGVAEAVDEILSELYVTFRLESIRGMQAARLGAQLNACLLGKKEAGPEDVAQVLPAALRHRVEEAELQEIMLFLQAKAKAASDIFFQPNSNSFTRPGEKGRGFPGIWRSFWQQLTGANPGHPGCTDPSGHMPGKAVAEEKKSPPAGP